MLHHTNQDISNSDYKRNPWTGLFFRSNKKRGNLVKTDIDTCSEFEPQATRPQCKYSHYCSSLSDTIFMLCGHGDGGGERRDMN